MQTARPEVAVYYCGLWHRYDLMDAWKGFGWNEWQLLKSAKPRFAGHRQPIVPEWGYFDESQPQWMSRQIDLAADHGIDVMIFDWYWYSGTRIFEAPLERAFIPSPNARRLKFALMWANHDWSDYFPAPAPGKPWNSWLPMRHSADDTLRVIDYCIEHYFREPNYWRVGGGKLYFSLFRPVEFVHQLGGASAARAILNDVDQRLRRHDLPPMHWNGIFQPFADLGTQVPAELQDLRTGVQMIRDAGFASFTSYNIVRTDKVSGNFTSEYDDLIEEHHASFRDASGMPLPYAPVVSMGWDCTPRCRYDVPWPFPPSPVTGNLEYPYIPVVVGNTPAKVEALARLAREHVSSGAEGLNAVFVNAWNEWTEGAYLLPDVEHGTAYLEAIQRALG